MRQILLYSMLFLSTLFNQSLPYAAVEAKASQYVEAKASQYVEAKASQYVEVKASQYVEAIASQYKDKSTKQWTFLIFLNGKNNLDPYGAMNINQMEKIGSTDQINIVVQWASTANKTTKRLYVQKDNDINKVTSPVIQDMGKVDMGDWNSLVDFIKWGSANYPAQHYFVDVWDHGSGWHLDALDFKKMASGYTPNDISWDDDTGHFISTEQLGMAMRDASGLIGHKIDLYGSDACLMAMAEVANEMSDSVAVSVGSEETEPAEGWPYDTFLKSWAAMKNPTPADVAKALTTEYFNAYQGGEYGTRDVTFSAFDLSKMESVHSAIKLLGQNFSTLSAEDRKKIVTAAGSALNFYYSDYVDFQDFMKKLQSLGLSTLGNDVFVQAKTALSDFVILNKVSPGYAAGGGLAVWLPTYMSQYNQYAERYKNIKFNIKTEWGKTLKFLLEAAQL